ncbi:hypothetical protein [Aeromicrobium sp.]|uniref:hypothetical protein n=1 Tax=Aeromicrobium sp. TaxID=1871063 RepID=UPI002FC86046|nr:hypothetical protein [Propionibacteriales bacterium]
MSTYAHSSSQAALYAEIERQTKAIAEERNLNALTSASTLKDLAIAYRLVHGGAQPGSAVVNK